MWKLLCGNIVNCVNNNTDISLKSANHNFNNVKRIHIDNLLFFNILK